MLLPPDPQQALAWAALILLLAATPGPSMAYVVACTGRAGFVKGGVAAASGNALGICVFVLALALGAGPLFQAWPQVQALVGWAGAACMAYFAYGAARRVLRAPERSALPEAPGRLWRRVAGGAATNLTNPAAWWLYMAAAPRFAQVPAEQLEAQIAALGVIAAGITFCTYTAVALAAAHGARWAQKGPPALGHIAQAALALIFTGYAIAFTGVL